MLLAAAILGWLAALVFAVLLWRTRRPRPRAYQPTTATHTLVLPVGTRYTAELYAADGSLESVRTVTKAPATIQRLHGRQPATVYRLRGVDGTRARYEAVP